MSIRRIRAGDGSRLRAIRLAALADEPNAFGETLRQAGALSDQEYDARASAWAEGDAAVFLVTETEQNRWIGMVGARNQDGRIAMVSMWVSLMYRRRGLGVELIDACLAWAATTPAREVYLFVGDYNLPAQALYAAMGFEPSGRTAPLDWNTEVTELEMVRPL
jgi:RimJ/RimL family protein N-acetyltransferase